MGLLGSLLGGGGDQRRRQYEDFGSRFDRGDSWDNVSDREVYDRYDEVARDMPDDDYEAAAEEAFARMSPEQRRQFARQFQAQGLQRGDSFIDRNRDGIDDRLQEDPRYLARMTNRARHEDPGLLQQIMGEGEGGGLFSNPIAKAAIAGIAAMAFRRVMGGRR